MTADSKAGERAEAFFEDLWLRGDPWNLETSEFERAKYAREIALLRDRRYARALEIGCGAGSFTKLLASLADHTTALDVSKTAVAEARAAGIEDGRVSFRVANIMELDLPAEGTWDLIVLNETIYYLGWLYSFFDVSWLAAQLHDVTMSGGRLMMTNTRGGCSDYLVSPWIIETYRDLFLNVGFDREAEEVVKGAKDEAELEVLMSLFKKA